MLMDGPPAQPRRSPLRSIPTHPCPRCGAAVPLGARFCPICAFPQPIRGPGCLLVLLILLIAILLLSIAFGWTTTPADRAARATATAQMRTVLPATPAGYAPPAITPSISPAQRDTAMPPAAR
jgi:zinc ribbon protein